MKNTEEKLQLRDQLFPEGMPTPELFILTVAAYIRENLDLQNEKTPE